MAHADFKAILDEKMNKKEKPTTLKANTPEFLNVNNIISSIEAMRNISQDIQHTNKL